MKAALLAGVVVLAFCGLARAAEPPPVTDVKQVIDAIPANLLPAKGEAWTKEHAKPIQKWLQENFGKRPARLTINHAGWTGGGTMRGSTEKGSVDRDGVTISTIVSFLFSNSREAEFKGIHDGAKLTSEGVPRYVVKPVIRAADKSIYLSITATITDGKIIRE